MSEFLFKAILQEDGWQENVVIKTNTKGIVESICSDCERKGFRDFAVPGFQNAHSHAFQYAMAGLAELHSVSNSKLQNDFWSWRKAMYDLALNITPNQMENIASMLYKEMLRNGYTHVAEFHYLHHDLNGGRYDNLSEMGERIVAAAKRTGIKLTLIPIFYQNGGFGRPAEKQQRRFISNSLDNYLKLLEASNLSAKNYEEASVAYGIHSMRAVSPENIIALTKIKSENIPLHIHVSEQLKEIQDSIDFLGARPVEWLNRNVQLDNDFHLVHATHLVDEEINAIARSGANVVLCPSTEGNLGDGLFPLNSFLIKGGKWSIGTDSHVGLNPFEELRILDYGQRLVTHNRNTFGNNLSGDNGNIALANALINGRKAMGVNQKAYFEIGKSLDALVISEEHPLVNLTSVKNLSNMLVYSSDPSMYKGSLVNGQWKILNGQHKDDQIHEKFIQTLSELKVR